MLSSGVETQPVPLDSSMSAVVQELYSELPVSVSKELHADSEPSVIPDLKPGASSSLVSQSRAPPSQLQRTRAASCHEDTSETLDHGAEPGWCGLVDPPAGGSVASGILDRKEKTKSMELTVFRDQGDQAEIVREPGEGAEQDPSERGTAAEEKMSPSQEDLLIQSSKELLCTDLPEDFLRNKEGNVQIVNETLLKSTEVQGMKVNGTETDNDEGHENGHVSKGLSAGCRKDPEVDRVMTSGEVSETSTLSSLKLLNLVDPGVTEATAKEKECGELKTCPSRLPGNSTISQVDSGKEELHKSHLVCEADDNQQQILSHPSEKHSSVHANLPATRNTVPIESLKEKSDVPYFSNSTGLESRMSLEKYSFENDGLLKGSAEKTDNSHLGEGDPSKNFTSKEENGAQLLTPVGERGDLFVVNGKQPTMAASECCSDEKETVGSPKENVLKSHCILGSLHTESSVSAGPSCGIETMELTIHNNENLKIFSDSQNNLTNAKDHRESLTAVSHLGGHTQPSSFSSSLQTEEPKWTATAEPDVLQEKICSSKDSNSLLSVQRNLNSDALLNEVPCDDFRSEKKSLVSSMPEDQGRSILNDLSKSMKGAAARLPTFPELGYRTESKKTVQSSQGDNCPCVDEQGIPRERNKLSYTNELTINKVESECVSNQQVSLNSEDHTELPTVSELNESREMPFPAREGAQQSHEPPLEGGADIAAESRTIPVKTKVNDLSPPSRETCGASSNSPTLNIKAGNLKKEGETADSGTEDVHSRPLSNKEASASPQQVTEFEKVQFLHTPSGLCVRESVPEEDTCLACAAFESGKITLAIGDFSVTKCKNAVRHSDPHSQRREDAVESSTCKVRYTSEEGERAGLRTKDSFPEDKFRNRMAAGVLSNGLSNKTSVRIKPSEERVERKEKEVLRHSAFCNCNISDCAPQGLNQSANIPSPERLLDQAPTVTFSSCKNVNPAAEALRHEADEVLDWQSNQNRSGKHRCKDKPAKDLADSDRREASTEPDVDRSDNPPEQPVSPDSTNPFSCVPKQDILEGALESVSACEEFTQNMADVVYTDHVNEATQGMLGVRLSSTVGSDERQGRLAVQETLQSTLPQTDGACIGTSEQDSGFPNAVAAATVGSLGIKTSCKEKLCQCLKDCEAQQCPDSCEKLDRIDTSLNICHKQQSERASQKETQRVTEGSHIEVSFQFDKENISEISSRELSPEGQHENYVSVGSPESIKITTPLCVSAQEDSEANVNSEEADLKDILKPEGEENQKVCTALQETKEGLPRDGSHCSEGDGTHISLEENAGKECPRHLPVTAQTETSNETEEHQSKPRGRLTAGEESGMSSRKRVGGGGGDMHKAFQTCTCRKRPGDAGRQQIKATSSSVWQKEEQHSRQKEALEPCSSSAASANEAQDRNQPEANQDEDALAKVVSRAEPAKGDTAQIQKLKDPKEESLCHPVQDNELSAGPCLPGDPQRVQDPSAAGCDQLRGAFGSTSRQKGMLPVKKQPHRTCKKVSCQEPVGVGRKISKARSSALLKGSPDPISTKAYRLLSSCAVSAPMRSEPDPVPPRSLVIPIPKRKATPCHPLRSLNFRKPTKESALLNKLSVLASRLAPATKPQKLTRYRRCSFELLPNARSYKRLRYKRLLDGFSCNTMPLNVYLAAGAWDKRPSSKSLALYSLDAMKMSFVNVSHEMPSLLFGSKIFPVSFHSDCLAESSRTFPEHCAPARLTSGEAVHCPSPPPKWAFSLFLSHSCPGTAMFRDETGLHGQARTQAPPQPPSPPRDYRGTALVETSADCSVLGLHTLLALCSPGCYRIWTKKRSFSSHMPTVQRFFMTQFTQGLKGLRSPASIANKVFCSLPYSVGRVLSIWSQHGPSACSLEISALHPTPSKEHLNLDTTSSWQRAWVESPGSWKPGTPSGSPVRIRGTQLVGEGLLLAIRLHQHPVMEDNSGTCTCPWVLQPS
ncbi:protein PRR14L isoform X2 [Ochotona princeps]|uniref:protein PRR14L isoform X2 n=1 Tax=Ochotona princeps TaxID=9978 RepID=UPI00271540C6|nr:protein PRR14L isoform X2 [Ochotona princeps]